MTVRLYAHYDFSLDPSVVLSDEQSHYVRSVMRLRDGDRVLLFHETCGEFECHLSFDGKKNAKAFLGSQTRSPTHKMNRYHLQLASCLIKRPLMERTIQDGTALGVHTFQFLSSERTRPVDFRLDRAHAISIETSEQCGRISVPSFLETSSLRDFLHHDHWDVLCFADERRAGVFFDFLGQWNDFKEKLSEYMKFYGRGKSFTRVSLLVGPEGGFSTKERLLIDDLMENQNSHKKIVFPVCLSRNILRAELASTVGLSWIASVLSLDCHFCEK